MVQGEINPNQRVTLRGNTLPLVSASQGTAYDLGRVDDSQIIDGMYLVLKRPPERETALRQFLADVQNPASPDYRKWLSPEEFGRRFGPADSDIAALKAWLESNGVTVKGAPPGRIALPFSATAGAIRAALGMEIHRYSMPSASPQTVRDESARSPATRNFLSNAGDPQIPAAFAELVAGVSPIGARPEAQLAVKGPTTYNLQTHQATPSFSVPSGSTVYELSPSDFAMQYGLAGVYSAGISGAGQTIGIVSDSNVDLSLVNAYRAIFNLPVSTPTVVVDGNDPGITSDATETYLDLEEAGAVAPGAAIMLYTSSGAILSDGLLTAAIRAVADNQATVLSVSYSACEAALGVGGNAAWAALWQQAAAQGISVFVAAGDAGSAGCDTPAGAAMALSGLGVNGLASTPYDTAVGGTDFYYSSYAVGGSALASQIASYWGTTAATTPAIGLLQPAPEQVWNDSFGFNTMDAGVYAAANASVFAGGGGASSAAIQGPTGALAGYPKPPWQSGAGVPADSVRDLPDVALFAGDGANGVYLPVCALPGDCVPSANTVTLTSVGGTSAAAPAMAAIQALVNVATNAPNGRSGLTAGLYYALATQYASAATKPLRDISTGTNQVPCYAGTLNCTLGSGGQTKGAYAEAGYPSTSGYDRASGLGSINVAALIADWSSLARKASAVTLAVTPTTLAHGTVTTAKVSVSPASGTGAPTGSVAILSNSPQLFANGLGVTNLANSSGTLTLSNLPGGTYQLTAEYGGDAGYLPSLSTPVTVTINQEQDTLTTSGWIVNPLDGALYPLAAGMQIPYGAELYLDAQPVGVNEAASTSAQNAPATGAITFTDAGSAATRTGSAMLNAQGVAEWAPGAGTVGTHVIRAAYAGDQSYAASSATAAASYTVFKGSTTMYLSPMQTTAVAGGSVTVDVQLFSQYLPLIGSLPTGSLTVTLGGQSKTAILSSSGPSGSAIEEAVVTFAAVPAGILPLSASYAGDANWNGASLVWGSISSSGTKPIPTVTLSASSTSLTPAQSITLNGSVAGPSGSTTAPTGSLEITWNGGAGSYSGTLTASGANASAYSLTIPAYAFQNGTNLLVASYSGDSTYAAGSSAPLSVTMAASDFSLTTATPQIAVTYGAPGAASVTLTPINGFSSPITVSCTAPTGITCNVGTASVTIGNGAADAISLTLGARLAAGTWPVEVIASGGGHTHSAQILVAATPQAPAPVFTPAAGTYTSAQLVTITDAAAGATIYYTTNGTTPTTASTKYISAISVSATETIRALATATGYITSPVSSATYTITPLTAAPLISPAGGIYATAQNVTITDATAGATIYYTTNGAVPTTSSTRYTGAISVSSTETINAVAIASGYALSTVATAAFTIGSSTATPTISPAPGTYTTAQSVTIADATSGAVIYYTTDGSTPTTSSTPYTGPITVASSETINAVAVASGYALSAVATASYVIIGPTATPVITPPSGNYSNALTVTITCATPGATIYYTTNGTTPTTASTKYTAPFRAYGTETVQAIAVAPGLNNSAVATAVLTFLAASPTFSPPAGTYAGAQTLTLTSATAGATIYYTTNGTTPTTSSARYTAPIIVSDSETIKAFAGEGGYTSSPTIAAAYVITSTSSVEPTKPHSPGPGSPLPTR